MNRIFVPQSALVAALLVVASFSAPAAQIELKSALHTTFITRGVLGGSPFDTRTNFSSGPLNDLFAGADPSQTVAQANASLFQILTLANVQGEVFQSHSEAAASTEFRFSPVTDVVTPIQLEFSAMGQFAWGGNDVSLVDLTTGTTLWRYYFDLPNGSNIPWLSFDGNGMGASLTLPTELFSSHDYRFSMSSWGSSSVPDSDIRLTQVFGLEVVQVPEPSSFALTLLAGIALFNARKRCSSQSDREY